MVVFLFYIVLGKEDNFVYMEDIYIDVCFIVDRNMYKNMLRYKI